MSLDMTISEAGGHSLHNQWLGHRYLTLHLIPILNIVNPAHVARISSSGVVTRYLVELETKFIRRFPKISQSRRRPLLTHLFSIVSSTRRRS